MEAQNFWDDQEKARETIDEVNQNKEWVDGWEELSTKLIDLEELKELIDVEEDEETLLEVDGELNLLQGELENLELKHMLGEREDKSNLHQEIVDALPNVSSVNLMPVVEGFSLDLEFYDIEPFSKASFEPYLSEQVLLELINLKCETKGLASLQLVRSEYS